MAEDGPKLTFDETEKRVLPDEAIAALFLPAAQVNAVSSIPIPLRLQSEIPRPKGYDTFQRGCVILFRDELKDPHVQEYGRSGQKQYGIDLLGCRNQKPHHRVGVQCRNVTKPLTYEVMLKDCRQAVAHYEYLHEIIFATTAPNDGIATDSAAKIEKMLSADGHDVRIVYYGWENLQQLIGMYDAAYSFFTPAALALQDAQQPLSLTDNDRQDLIEQIVRGVSANLRTPLPPPYIPEAMSDTADEDPALHARIDAYRDLFRKDGSPLLAERNLTELLNADALKKKPWAHFRIQTNLAFIEIHLGRNSAGIARFGQAYQLRPHDSQAKANLAFARAMEHDYGEAMRLAREALAASPRADHAICYLLQAAGRSDWSGDPETLIPADLTGSVHADVGLAEFYRFRETPDWMRRCIELARRHAEAPDLKMVNALAVLASGMTGTAIIFGDVGQVSSAEIREAADFLKDYAERLTAHGYGFQHDYLAHLNNAGVLLRICGRHQEVEELLRKAPPNVLDDPILRRLMALTLVQLNRPDDALRLLPEDADAETVLLRAEILGFTDPSQALGCAIAIRESDLPPPMNFMRWNIVGELGLRARRTIETRVAAKNLRRLDETSLIPAILELRADRDSGAGQAAFNERLAKVAEHVAADAPMIDRYTVANELAAAMMPDDAAKLLEGHVDLSRLTPASTLYLQSLAAARRDDAFRRALTSASAETRANPMIIWIRARHAWNMGDLPTAHDAVNELIAEKPKSGQAHLFKIEVLLRQNRSVDVLTELAQPLEGCEWASLDDRCRLASLLRHFGHVERGAALAYRIYLENRDNSRAWMSLTGVILGVGRGSQEPSEIWHPDVVGENSAIDIEFEKGERSLFIVEPDQELRRIDPEAIEPEHPLIRLLAGKPKGDGFIEETGRKGTIVNLRHKFVARLHHVLRNFQTRFPVHGGVQSMSVDPNKPNIPKEMLKIFESREKTVRQEEEQYVAGRLPLALMAARIGRDMIDAAEGLVARGSPLRVATGTPAEIGAAQSAIWENRRRGCVLDLLLFWTLWRTQALDPIVRLCGDIHIPQSMLDDLRMRRERMAERARDEALVANYVNGTVVFQQIPAEVGKRSLDDLDRGIAWLEGNAVICPLVADDHMHEALREFVRLGLSNAFDSMIIAMNRDLLLLTDDQMTREFARSCGFLRSSWLHAALNVARNRRYIQQEQYVRNTAKLIDAGHNYVGVRGWDIKVALDIDAQAGKAPGLVFNSIIKVIGGKNADPKTHVRAVVECLLVLWHDDITEYYRKPGASALLRQLISYRHDDYKSIIYKVLRLVQSNRDLLQFVDYWTIGHFVTL